MPIDSAPQNPAATPADAVPALSAINVPKASEVLAARLRDEILAGRFAPGSPLPAERDLVATTGLGRGSVREALRILEAQGMVKTRSGRYGGSVVSKPSDALLAGQIGVFARGHGVSLLALVEARQAIEPMVAFLAARNRTPEDLAALHEVSARLETAAQDDVPRFLLENDHWHAALAAASHNDLLRAFSASIAGLMLDASRLEYFGSPDVRGVVVVAHRRILAAIEKGDAEAARRRAERDLEGYARHLEAAVAAAQRKAARRGARAAAGR